MQDMIVLLTAVTGISVISFLVVSILWMRKTRHSMTSALSEMANNQLHSVRRFTDVIAQLQKQQSHLETQLHTLSQSNAQLRQSLVSVATQLQHGQADASRVDPTIH